MYVHRGDAEGGTFRYILAIAAGVRGTCGVCSLVGIMPVGARTTGYSVFSTAGIPSDRPMVDLRPRHVPGSPSRWLLRHVPGHHRAGSDDRAGADPPLGQDHAPGAQEDTNSRLDCATQDCTRTRRGEPPQRAVMSDARRPVQIDEAPKAAAGTHADQGVHVRTVPAARR